MGFPISRYNVSIYLSTFQYSVTTEINRETVRTGYRADVLQKQKWNLETNPYQIFTSSQKKILLKTLAFTYFLTVAISISSFGYKTCTYTVSFKVLTIYIQGRDIRQSKQNRWKMKITSLIYWVQIEPIFQIVLDVLRLRYKHISIFINLTSEKVTL